MSLYGLDILLANDGRRILTEINGVCSGMNGFSQVYGDDRVAERVYDMLREEHGEITVNDGTYSREQFKKRHPIIYMLETAVLKIPRIKKLLLVDPILNSKKAETDWLKERGPSEAHIEFPFETYEGQESTVIDLVGQPLPHGKVNSSVAEAITRNKFLQHLLLEETEVSDAITASSLVGLGATNEEELEELLSSYKKFVVKPVLGICGRGVEPLTRKEVASRYKHSRGPTKNVHPAELCLSLLRETRPRTKYIEDLIEEGNFSFEPGVSIVQPFVNTKRKGVYSVIRAIVCNGEFIDAYRRESPEQIVNLSKDAKATPFEADSQFASFCEQAVEVFEREAGTLSPETFRQELYGKYISRRGKTTTAQRKADRTLPLFHLIDEFIGSK